MAQIGGSPCRSSSRLDGFFTLSLDPLYIAGFDGRFRAVNPAFERALGYCEAEVVQIPILDLAHPDDVPALREALACLVAARPVELCTNRYRHHGGGYRTFTWTATPVAADGLFYGIARDETDRLRLEAAEVERARMEGVLLATRTMLHELSNDLAMTIGYADLLMADPRLPSDLMDVASIAAEGAQQAAGALVRLQRLVHLREIDIGAPDGTVLDLRPPTDGAEPSPQSDNRG